MPGAQCILLLLLESSRYDSETYLIKIKHQIQFTNIPKKLIQHLNEEMYSLQIRELRIVRVDADAEEEPRVPPVDDLGRLSELDEVGLVFLVAGRD